MEAARVEIPFIDVWAYEETPPQTGKRGALKFFEEPDSIQLAEEGVHPIHYRPVGRFWVPFAHRPLELLRLKDFPNHHSVNGPLPVLDECVSSRYSHITETHRLYAISAACLSLADRFPLVTRRIRRTACPYSGAAPSSLFGSWMSQLRQFAVAPSPPSQVPQSRLLRCLGRPQPPETRVIIHDPAEEWDDLHLGQMQEDFSAFPAPWDMTPSKPKPKWPSPPADGPPDETRSWPVFYVWECPERPSTMNLELGMIEDCRLLRSLLRLLKFVMETTRLTFFLIPASSLSEG